MKRAHTVPLGKKMVFFFIMMATSLIAALLLAEIIVRIFFPQQESIRWFKSDPRYGYVNKADFHQKCRYLDADFVMDVRTNSFGHRAKEYDLSKKGVKRVLVLGDSFVFGYGLNAEAISSNVLEKMLNKDGERYLVINSGVGGWGTLQEITYARDHFSVFRPDIIVLTFCGNDPVNDVEYQTRSYDLERGMFYFPGKIFLRDHSQLYRFLVAKNYTLWWNWAMNKKKAQGLKEDGSVASDIQSGSVISEGDWEKTLKRITDFQRDFHAFNPDGILLIQATQPLNADIREHLGSLSNGKNMFYVDLYDDTERLEPDEQKAGKDDAHWSGRMHEISARNIYNEIRRLGK